MRQILAAKEEKKKRNKDQNTEVTRILDALLRRKVKRDGDMSQLCEPQRSWIMDARRAVELMSQTKKRVRLRSPTQPHNNSWRSNWATHRLQIEQCCDRSGTCVLQSSQKQRKVAGATGMRSCEMWLEAGVRTEKEREGECPHCLSMPALLLDTSGGLKMVKRKSKNKSARVT